MVVGRHLPSIEKVLGEEDLEGDGLLTANLGLPAYALGMSVCQGVESVSTMRSIVETGRGMA